MTTQYSKLVSTLFKDGPAILADANAPSFSLLHAAVGIVGEVYEYASSDTRENAIEELGDILFYVHAASIAVGQHPDNLLVPLDFDAVMGEGSTRKAIDAMYTAGFDLLDVAKKAAFYNKRAHNMPRVVGNLLSNIHVNLTRLAYSNGTTLEKLEETNTAKLSNRYAKGYSDQAAQERADKAEEQARIEAYETCLVRYCNACGHIGSAAFTQGGVCCTPLRANSVEWLTLDEAQARVEVLFPAQPKPVDHAE